MNGNGPETREFPMNQVLTREAFAASTPFDGHLSAAALDQIFRKARTHNGWLAEPVPHALLEEAVELAKLGPTAVNASPFRVVFVESEAAKARLKPTLSPGNLEKTMSAPVTAIVAHDLAFHDHLPRLFPHANVRPMFADNEAAAAFTANQNGTLQLAYFILALRAVGLDTGPMGGFDKDKLDAEFFAGTKIRSNVLVNIGYGDHSKLFPRSPRLAYEEIARFA
jgi:3-hydroxypropanoate dehydrogenase